MRPAFRILGLLHISGTVEARNYKFGRQIQMLLRTTIAALWVVYLHCIRNARWADVMFDFR